MKNVILVYPKSLSNKQELFFTFVDTLNYGTCYYLLSEGGMILEWNRWVLKIIEGGISNNYESKSGDH